MTDLSKIYGSTFRYGSREVIIDPDLIVYAEDAIQQLPDVVRHYSAGTEVLVLMDSRTQDTAGLEAVDVLREDGMVVSKLVVPDPAPGKTPVCDDVTFAALKSRCESPDIILTVGSGVMNDLGKWLAVDLEIPYVSFATAASMNGYASANVAPSIDGVKTLQRGHAPTAVIANPAIIAAAPFEMTASGLGDVAAKSVSSIDWRVNHLLFGDEYIPEAVDLIAGIEALYFDHPQAIRDRDPAAIKALFDALLLTGVAMTMAGTSSPASGGEHLVSHGLDMLSSIDGAPHDLHGRQVGVGTILCADLYERIIATESPDINPSAAVTNDFSFWGPLGGSVRDAYRPKFERIEKAAAILTKGSAWDDLRTEIEQMLRPSASIRDCLERAGAAHKPEHIGCTPERLQSVFEHCHEMRARFTVIDLARIVGIMPSCAAEIVDSLQ